MKDIEKWSVRYTLVKSFVFLFFRLTYRRFSINGLENIPQNKPVILAPNHQNALMDALAIVFSKPGQPVFLARADIFKNKLAAYFLNIFKLMPVYRIRDGKDSLVNNQNTFDSSIRVLMNNKVLCLFPEAAHIGMKSMLPHKKAIPRIAFLTGEKTNFEIDIQVVPVGLYYSHYYKFRSDLVVQFGKPIPIKEYYEIFCREGEYEATMALRDRIFLELSKLCVNVPDKEDYGIYEQGFEILRGEVCEMLNLKTSIKNFVKAEQYIIQKLKPFLDAHLIDKENLLTAATEYHRLKVELDIYETTIKKGVIGTLEMVKLLLLQFIFLPFSLFGAILHGWLFRYTNYSFRKKIKDTQFYSTFSLGISVILFPIWMVILFVIFTLILKNGVLSFVLVVVSILCGIIAWEMCQLYLRIINRFRFGRMKESGNCDLKILLEKRAFLISVFDEILN